MISFRKASKRNTKCYKIWIGDHGFYLSYETVIGYSGPLGHFRLQNVWGPTTGKHINEMGIRDYELVDEQRLEKIEQLAICETAKSILGSTIRNKAYP